MSDPAAVRAYLQRLAEERGNSLMSLSKLIGRNPAYLQQFVARGSPAVLAEDDRLVLAKHFRIDERLLGARDPWTPDDDA